MKNLTTAIGAGAIHADHEHRYNDYIASGQTQILGDVDHRKLTAEQNPLPIMGSEQVFKIAPRGNMWLSDVILVSSVSSVNKTGGSYARLCNAFPIHMVDQIRLLHHGRQFWSKDNFNHTYQKVLQHNDDEWLYVHKKRLGIMNSNERNSASSDVQTFSLNFNEFCSFFSVPVPLFVAGGDIEIRIKYKTMDEVIETDGSNPSFSFLKSYLDVKYIDPGHNDLMKREVERAASRGQFRIVDYSPLNMRFNVPVGSSRGVFNLTSLQNKHVIYMNITSRDVSKVNSGDYTSYNKVLRYNLDSAGRRISGAEYDITDSDFRHILIDDYGFKGVKTLIDENIYTISYASNLSNALGNDHHELVDCKSFRGINDARLTIEYSEGVADSQQVDIDCSILKTIFIHPGRIVSIDG